MNRPGQALVRPLPGYVLVCLFRVLLTCFYGAGFSEQAVMVAGEGNSGMTGHPQKIRHIQGKKRRRPVLLSRKSPAKQNFDAFAWKTGGGMCFLFYIRFPVRMLLVKIRAESLPSASAF